MIEAMSAHVDGILGFMVGAIAAFAVRRAKLCTFGAIEDALIGGNTKRLKAFGISLAVALLATQGVIVAGLLDPGTSSLVPNALPWLGALLGGLAFGIGMALVGTCAFGSLVRFGGGDLRALVVLLIIGAVAYATGRGLISPLRMTIAAQALDLPDLRQGDLPGLLHAVTGYDLRLPLALALGFGLLAWALRDPRLRQSRRLMLAGATLGLAVFAGWLVTGILADILDVYYRPTSLSFVSPVGRLTFSSLAGSPRWLDFGTGSVLGVIAGAGLAAWSLREWRWEAFDDHHEMRRHLLGAVLMGFGGMVAGGCTIGQGLSAGSLLSLGAPIAVLGIVIGARLGVAFLVETEVIPQMSRRLTNWIVKAGGARPVRKSFSDPTTSPQPSPRK